MRRSSLARLLLIGVAALLLVMTGCSVDRNPTSPEIPKLLSLDQVTKTIPQGYYDSVDTSSPDALRQSLHQIIKDHTKIPYTSSSTDTWDVLDLACEDPGNPNNILDIYRNASYPKAGGGNTYYNREHCWPKSYGFPNDGSTNYPYTDLHHLFLCDSGYNSSRSNKPYRYCDAGCTEKPTEVNDGMGGGTGVYPGNSNWTSGSYTSGTWETWIDRRGDVARALLYMDVRYEGGVNGNSGAPEPDLILTDDEALIAASNTGSNEPVAYMGMLSVLLQWCQEDPVDDIERSHNEIVYLYQGNRNPFVDHPEWISCVFQNDCGGTPPPPPPPSGTAWINEFHYDNSGTDTGEFVEVAGPAGTDLAGWQLLGYNGNGGTVYKTVNLSGILPDQLDGYGTLSFTFSSLQNGSPDGIALVDASGQVVEFLSYEGTLTAADGPAAGMTSVDVGVAESGTTPAGESLQRTGDGTTAADFAWTGPAAASPGAVNAGQSFGGTTPPSANQAPTAEANGPYSGTEGQAVSFSSAGSSDPDGSIVSYLWDFGDGVTSTAADPSHTYAAAGTYTVTLTVTDDQGATGTATTTADIAPASGGTTDTVTISKAEYDRRKTKLTVLATTDDPNATLTLEGYGPMQWNSKKKRWEYKDGNVPSAPATVTVTSTSGGSATSSVTIK